MSVTSGCLAAFALLYILFSKVFPIISVWEVQEGVEEAIPEITERFTSYMPDAHRLDVLAPAYAEDEVKKTA